MTGHSEVPKLLIEAEKGRLFPLGLPGSANSFRHGDSHFPFIERC